MPGGSPSGCSATDSAGSRSGSSIAVERWRPGAPLWTPTGSRPAGCCCSRPSVGSRRRQVAVRRGPGRRAPSPLRERPVSGRRPQVTGEAQTATNPLHLCESHPCQSLLRQGHSRQSHPRQGHPRRGTTCGTRHDQRRPATSRPPGPEPPGPRCRPVWDRPLGSREPSTNPSAGNGRRHGGTGLSPPPVLPRSAECRHWSSEPERSCRDAAAAGEGRGHLTPPGSP